MKLKPYSFRFPSIKPKSHDTSIQAPDFASARKNDQMLVELQRDTFGYFLHETNTENGLVIDKNKQGWPASIAAVGLALTPYQSALSEVSSSALTPSSVSFRPCAFSGRANKAKRKLPPATKIGRASCRERV